MKAMPKTTARMIKHHTRLMPTIHHITLEYRCRPLTYSGLV
jgi:hypothetical protein